MTSTTVPDPSLDLPVVRAARHAAVPLLQAFSLSLMVFPSDAVVSAVGALGFVASLVALALFGLYGASVVLGLHDPLQHRNPVRLGFGVLWCASLVSYALMNLDERPPLEASSATRWLLLLAGMTGVALVASECLTSVRDLRRVARALVWGGAFCGLVAGLQFWTGFDVAAYLRQAPGLTMSEGYSSIMSRGALSRVAGTALHPIELGVVAGMLLPVAVHLGLHDVTRSPRRRWAPVVLIAVALPVCVSRSAVLSLVIALSVLLALLPRRQRLTGLALVPFGLVGVFMTTPGLITTLGSFFAAGSSDPSVATRIDDYPMVERMVGEHPWFGQGGATFSPADALEILDNQYLKTAIELGLVGLLGLALYAVLPVLVALTARARSEDPELRTLCSALAAALTAAVVCPLTFDAFSFPMFTLLQALLAGMVGGAWAVVHRTSDSAPSAPVEASPDLTPHDWSTP